MKAERAHFDAKWGRAGRGGFQLALSEGSPGDTWTIYVSGQTRVLSINIPFDIVRELALFLLDHVIEEEES